MKRYQTKFKENKYKSNIQGTTLEINGIDPALGRSISDEIVFL